MSWPAQHTGGRLDARACAVLERAETAERNAAAALPGDDPLDPKRRLRTDATGPELRAQPEIIERNWRLAADRLDAAAARIRQWGPRQAMLVGAGDSLAVMIAARAALETALGITCEPVEALELAYYETDRLGRDTLVVALSSSGETTRTIEATLRAQAAGALTIALTNQPTSTLATESDEVILVDATRKGWPTQSSTAPLALLLRLAAVSAGTGTDELDRLPELMREAIDRADDAIAAQAEYEARGAMFSFTGAGPSYAAALVGAAKVKECTPDHAIAVQLEEFHHYNSLKAGEPLWMIVPAGPSLRRGVDTVCEARRLGGHVHAITSDGVDVYDGLAQTVLQLPAVPEPLSPLVTFPAAQLVGLHIELVKRARAESGDAD